MDLLKQLMGSGEHLTVFQMCVRAVLIFFFTLFLIRIAGKRSFGMRMPLDNVLTILLGAILSRAIIGASPFLPTICAAFTLTLLYRFVAGLGYYSKWVGSLVKGKSRVLYQNEMMIQNNMKSSMITEHDLMEGMRINGNIDSLNEVEKIYEERNGEISVIKKKKNEKYQ